MAPMAKGDIDAIAEAVMARHKSGEIPSNGGGKEVPAPEPEPEAKTWWQKTRVPIAAAAGVIVAISGGILTWGIAWGGSQHEMATLKADVIKVQAEVAAKAEKVDVVEVEKRTRVVEQQGAVNVTDHAVIKQDLAEQKADIKEVRKAQVEQDKKLDRILAKMKP